MKRALFALLTAAACSGPNAAEPSPAEAAKTAQATTAPGPKVTWKAVIDATDRTEKDRKLDAGRKPAEMLEFLDLKAGMKVADLGAGGGYTTELLARAVGAQGTVYMQNAPEWANGFLKNALADRFTHPAMAKVIRVDLPFQDPLPPEAVNLDAVVMNAIYHDVAGETKTDRLRMNRNVFNALQAGGTYTVIDSSAADGSGLTMTDKLHRIDEKVVRDEVLKAGFKLAAEGSFLRNPQDARDWNASPGDAKEKRGTSDRFVLKFVRPEGAKAWTLPPTLRLPAGARPTHVTAQLTIDPTQDQFEGEEELALNLDAATPLLWLNADSLKILDTDPKSEVIDAQPGFVGLRFAQPLPQGASTLKVRWQGTLSRTDDDGLFRQQEGSEWYALSHLEPTGARRIFPSFDEPSFKVPWKISLKVRKTDTPYFNTPQEGEEAAGEQKIVRFAETRPLPAYLLAIFVGPFERVDAGKMKSGAPVGIVVTKGKTAQAAYSAKSSPALMNILEDYFGMPYNYSKLDLIEIPVGTGAMENPGLISFNQRINLAKPGEETPQFRYRAADVEAHEFGHLWFGDQVTTAWWDDIWLNEAFATWLASKTIETWQPTWHEPALRANSMEGAMQADRLLSARRIRQPILSENDIKTAFDGITYNKGAAVIGMFEQWVGPEAFRKGTQRYLNEHRDGNGTSKDFLAAISTEAKKDVAEAFSTFLDQGGLPLVSMKLSCEGGKGQLALSQARYLPLGAGEAGKAQTWQLPVCVRAGAAKGAGEVVCTLLKEPTQTLALSSCPAWVMPNANAKGYYRSSLDADAQAKLTAALPKLSVAEKIVVAHDAAAGARAGTVDYAQVLALLPALAADKDRTVVTLGLSLVAFLRDARFFPDAQRPAYAKLVRDLFGKRAAALGFAGKKGEDDDARTLRPALLVTVGDQGEDPTVLAQARKVAGGWLKDHQSTTPELAEAALALSARYGDRAFFDKLLAAARAEKDRRDRMRILSALGRFQDPALAQDALDLSLNQEFDPRESFDLVWATAGRLETRDRAIAFVDKNFEEIVKRLPRDSGANLGRVASGGCDEKYVAVLEEKFKERVGRYAGGERRFDQELENLRQCVAFRARQTPSVTAFLQQRH